MAEPVYILGAGMHPWGKWGRDFTEYGVVAARAATTPPFRKRTRRSVAFVAMDTATHAWRTRRAMEEMFAPAPAR